MLFALLALAFLTVLAVAAQPASAYSSYEHDGATSCGSCHPGGDTNVPPTDANCTACHTGGFQSRQTGASRDCWTCHDPGQSMTTVQTAAGCGSAAAGAGCHNGAAHYGSTAVACTTCHGVVQSATNPGTSAHHNNTVYTAPSTCTDCHTTPHTPYITGVTCDSCHQGMGTTHPAVGTMPAPSFTLAAKPTIVKYGLTTILSGALKSGTTGIAGKTVTLQSKPLGDTDFAFVAEATTAADGTYSFAARSPSLFTTYRVVAPGAVVNTTVVKPGLRSLDVKVRQILTISLSKSRFALGGRVVIKGTVTPVRTGVVKLTIQRKISGRWKTQLTTSRTISATSTYSYTYKPLRRGPYRVKATVGATTGLLGVTTSYKGFTVR